MPEQVNVDEVVACDAALDALDDPTSSQVYYATDEFSAGAVAAVAAKRALEGGGGGGGGPTILGPYTVNWNSAGIDGDGLTLATLDAGTQLISAWAQVVTEWDTSASLGISVAGLSNVQDWWTVFSFDAAVPAPDAAGVIVLAQRDDQSNQVGAVYGEDGLLLAMVNQSGASQGQALVYAMVVLPS